MLPCPRRRISREPGQQTLQERSSTQVRQSARVRQRGRAHVFIIMLDDAGFAQADTAGGLIHTPTLTCIADMACATTPLFHTTAICSAHAPRC